MDNFNPNQQVAEQDQLSFFDTTNADEFTNSTFATTDLSHDSDEKSCNIIEQKSELLTYLDEMAHIMWPAVKTRENSSTRVRRFDAFGNNSKLKLDDITAKHIYTWLDYERKRGLSDASINRYTSAMSRVLNQLVADKIISSAPRLVYNKEFPRERYYTDSEVNFMIRFFKERNEQWMADLIYVGLNTGMRLGEILSLGIVRCGKASHWGEVKVENDHLYLPAKICKNKTGRMIGINKSVREACVRLQTSIGQNFTHRKFYDRWALLKREIAPNDDQFVFHCIRHTAASFMANNLQMNQALMMDVMGHKSPETSKKYVHQKPEEMSSYSSRMTLGAGV